MKPTLLIVDDLKEVRDLIRNGLAHDFNVVAEAADGIQAVEAWHHYHPQVIVMDVVMPRESGIEATRLILQDWEKSAKTLEIPKPVILMLSGIDEQSVVLQAMGVGALDYLLKPVNVEQLRKALLNYLHPKKLKIAV